MNKITITFSDGKKIEFQEEQTFQAIKYMVDRTSDKNNLVASKSEFFTLWSHINKGLIPSFFDLISNSEYFFDIEEPDTIYSSKSIVRIEK